MVTKGERNDLYPLSQRPIPSKGLAMFDTDWSRGVIWATIAGGLFAIAGAAESITKSKRAARQPKDEGGNNATLGGSRE
jgi:hypothetical protein